MFRITQTLDDLVKVFVVRGIVFIGEQNTSYREEIDEHEHTSVHIIGEIDREPVAAARIRFQGEYAKLERLAVRREWRGQGYGDQLIEFMMKVARDLGYTKFKLHAQITAREFYEKHGFHAVGDTFMEADIEHCLMMKEE